MCTATETACPVIASPDDISRETANRAFHGTSFDPEKRGQSRREEYAADVNGLYAELWPHAHTDEQRALLAAEMARYRQGLLERMVAYLHSHSNVVSAMIAGPSNFPTARMQKRGQWADNKVRDMLEWRAKARAAIKRKLLDARPDEVKQDQEWRLLARDIASSLGVILSIDEGASFYTRSAFVNSISGKVERLAHNGEFDLVEKALDLVRQYNTEHKKPAISARHKFWTFADVAKRIQDVRSVRVEAGPETIFEANGIEAIANPAADRIQISFPSRESAAPFIGALKAEGWHWSPSGGVWQRKLTENAKYSARRILARSE